MNNAEVLTKILGGVSKSLGIANKLLPVFHDTKPLFDNFKSIFTLFDNNSKINNASSDNTIIKEDVKKTITNSKSDSPQFFI